MSNVIPMDQHAAAESEKRAQAEEKRAKRYELKQKIAAKTLDLKRHQQKLREITECNATPLSANGDLLIRQEMTRLQGEIEKLLVEQETLSRKP